MPTPVTMLTNFLENIVSQVSPAAWPMFAVAIVVICIKGYAEVQNTSHFPWKYLMALVGSCIICYTIWRPDVIAGWIKGLAGIGSTG